MMFGAGLSFRQTRAAGMVPVLAAMGLLCPHARASPWLELEERAKRLDTKLRGPGPVRILAFGDSLTSGWGVGNPERNTYHQLFAAALRARFHNCRIDVITAGGPGDESAVGLQRLTNEVIRKDPDLVIIQFAGNDSRLGRSPSALQQNVERLVQEVMAGTAAVVLLAANPMNDPAPGNPYVGAVLEAGRRTGVPIANFDQALFETHRDFRGPFAYESHPGQFSHAAWAKELLAKFDELLGTERLFNVTIGDLYELVATGRRARVAIRVDSLVDRRLIVAVDSGALDLPTRHTVKLEPGGTQTVELDIPVPPLTTQHRSTSVELFAVARCGRYSSFDAKWLTFAPVLVPDKPRGPIDEGKLSWHRLTHDGLVLNEGAWGGDWDLSGRFALVDQRDRLLVLIDVTDDDITVASPGQRPSSGDSIEVYLDLRPVEEQGLPVYGERVVGILAVPATSDGRPSRWQPLDRLVPLLTGVSFSSHPTPQGYRCVVSIPQDALSAGPGGDWSGIGFDVGLNDADFGAQRSTQMFYCGHADNYLDPSRFAGLARTAPGRPLWRVTLH